MMLFILIGPSECEVATTLNVSFRDLHVRGWKYIWRKPRAFHLSEIRRVQCCETCRGCLLKWRRRCCIRLLLWPTNRHNAQWASLDFGGSIFLIWQCYSGAFTEWPEKLLFWAGARTREDSDSAGCCGSSMCGCYLEPLEAPIGELQHRLLMILEQSPPSPTDKVLSIWASQHEFCALWPSKS